MRTRRMRSSPRWSNRGIRAGPIGMAYSPFSFVVVGAALAASSAAFFFAARVAAAFFAAAERAAAFSASVFAGFAAEVFLAVVAEVFFSPEAAADFVAGFAAGFFAAGFVPYSSSAEGFAFGSVTRFRGLGLRRGRPGRRRRDGLRLLGLRERAVGPRDRLRRRSRGGAGGGSRRGSRGLLRLLGLLGGALLVIAGLALGEALLLAGGSRRLLLVVLADLSHLRQGVERVLERLIGVRVVDFRLDDLVHLLLGVPEFRDGLPQRLGHGRQLVGPEDEEPEQQDEKKLESTNTKQSKPLCAVSLNVSSRAPRGNDS